MKKEDNDLSLDLFLFTWICTHNIQFLLCSSSWQSWSNWKAGASFLPWATKSAQGHADSLELATSQLKGQDQTRPGQLLVWKRRGNGHKLKHRRLCLNIRKHFFWTRWPTEVPSNPYYSVILWFCEVLQKVSREGCGVSLLGDIQKPSRHSPG